MDLLLVAGTNRNSLFGYVVAAATVGLAFLLRLSTGDVLAAFPYLIFVPPVLVSCFFGGLGPGLVAAIGSIVLVQIAYLSPSQSLVPATATEWMGIVVFMINSLLIMALIESLLTAHRKQADLRSQLLEFNVQLGKLVDERTEALKLEISEHAASQSQLRQLQKMETIGQLTGGIAHDFNNMLAVIVGSLDLADRRLAKGLIEESRQCIGHAREGARRAAVLTGRLLAFSRQQPLSPEPVDVNRLVGGMAELLRRAIGENIRIDTILGSGLWHTFADISQLENAILNLSVNARDAMPDGGSLIIETSNAELDERYARSHDDVRPGKYVLISVTDTGHGMEPDVIDRAFDPFYTTKGPGKGTGLGLSQVFGWVKQSGGHIKINSEPGHGTTVKIYLPRHVGSAAESDEAGSADTDLPRVARLETVLVVEDEENVRHMTVAALRELGYTVIEAQGGREALEAMETHQHVDLLFTDIVMPDMNGKMVADAAKARFPGLQVLYTTGYTRNAIVHNGVVDPGVELLTKPFTLQQLKDKLESMLRGR